jgi:hypothetical protein
VESDRQGTSVLNDEEWDASVRNGDQIIIQLATSKLSCLATHAWQLRGRFQELSLDVE